MQIRKQWEVIRNRLQLVLLVVSMCIESTKKALLSSSEWRPYAL